MLLNLEEEEGGGVMRVEEEEEEEEGAVTYPMTGSLYRNSIFLYLINQNGPPWITL